MSLHMFGTLPDGTTIHEARLRTAAGASASLIGLGATLRDLTIPLGGGESRRVVLGFPTLQGYVEDRNYIGVTAGRYASRIARGRFRLDGAEHRLTINDRGRNHLHGGTAGFSSRAWTILASDDASVTLALTSPDGDQGYPGTLEALCTYRLEEPATLRVVMTARTDAPTIVSLAHHSYFRLTPGASTREHALQVNAHHFAPLDDEAVATGEIRAVAGTPADFRRLRPIGAGDDAYDMIFVLDRADAEPTEIATLIGPDRRVRMTIHSTEPCLIFYDGGHIAPADVGLEGARYGRHDGLCLEPVRFPDSPNHPWFPQAVLRPGDVYRQVTEYRFSAVDPAPDGT